jgi:hypothetical protein
VTGWVSSSGMTIGSVDCLPGYFLDHRRHCHCYHCYHCHYYCYQQFCLCLCLCLCPCPCLSHPDSFSQDFYRSCYDCLKEISNLITVLYVVYCIIIIIGCELMQEMSAVIRIFSLVFSVRMFVCPSVNNFNVCAFFII